MKIAMIAAVGRNGVIGKDGKLPWHIPHDMKFFRRVTKGHNVLMGRKTWEAIGSKPLPDRQNIILSRTMPQLPFINGKQCANPGILNNMKTFHDAWTSVQPVQINKKLFIIGGAEIYTTFMHMADELYITHISSDYEGDTYFPHIGSEVWTVTHQRRISRNISHFKYERVHG